MITLILYFNGQRSEILYFYNKGCLISNKTDIFIENIQLELGAKVKITKIDPFDPKNQDNELVKKFNVKGVPTIVINGKIYSHDYNYTLFKNEVCRYFVLKPEKC
jgi:hypothetical protein